MNRIVELYNNAIDKKAFNNLQDDVLKLLAIVLYVMLKKKIIIKKIVVLKEKVVRKIIAKMLMKIKIKTKII